jgi:hypothetical protein
MKQIKQIEQSFETLNLWTRRLTDQPIILPQHKNETYPSGNIVVFCILRLHFSEKQ